MIDYAAIKELLKETVDPTSLVLSLGFSIYRETDLEIRAPCIIHGGDNKTAFQLKKNTKRFRCFTKRCDLDSSGNPDSDVIALVRKVKNCSFEEAISYLSALCGVSLEGKFLGGREIDKIINKKNVNKFLNTYSFLNNETTFTDLNFIKESHKKGCEYFEKRGVSKKIQNSYLLGTYKDYEGIERALVPIMDETGIIVGYSGRDTTDTKINKYDIRPSGLKKGCYLYNFDKAKKIQKIEDFVIIVEGFRALWHLVENGFENVVAAMGTELTTEQILILLRNELYNVLLWFDWDEAGQKGVKNAYRALKSFSNKFCVRIVLPMPELFSKEKQPDDFDCYNIEELIGLYF